MAACLRYEGVAARRTAAGLFHLDGFGSGPIEIIATGGRPTKGVSILRTSKLPKADVSRIGPIPVTTPTRTLCDLGAVATEEQVEIALECALLRRLTTVDRLERRLAALSARGRNGVGTLKRILDVRGDGAPAESKLEVLYRRMERHYRLPRSVRQFRVESIRRRLDFAYPDLKLGIEVDGGETHKGASARQRDAQRHNELTADGWLILYFTYEDVRYRPKYVAATVTAEVERRRACLF